MPDICTVKLYKWNYVGYARRYFKLDNDYLNYWHSSAITAGVQPNNSMCLNGIDMIVTGELKFELVASKRRWFMRAGCSFCMNQLLVIFANYQVKMVSSETMASETMNNLKIGVLTGVAASAITIIFPLIGFTSSGVARRAVNFGLSSLFQHALTSEEDAKKSTIDCTCRSY